MILRAYKYRLYPTIAQAEQLDNNFGACRFIWNQLVASFNSWSATGPNQKMSEKSLKDDPRFPWLKESISYALQQKRMDFDEMKKQYFNKNRKKKLGKPKFKKKGISNESFRLPGQSLAYNQCINWEKKTIRLPKLGYVKFTPDRRFSGQLRSVTISKNKCNQYFVSVLVQEEVELKQNTGKQIGVDLGLNHLAVLSDGTKIDNPRWFRESQAKLKRAQQHLSRKQKDSHLYQKQKMKVARIHLKIANQRAWFLHNLSNKLVSDYDVIAMEDLNIAGMKAMFGKSVSDAGWGKLVSMIKYKCNWYGKTFHQINRWYPSSKTCNVCGYKMEAMELRIREWRCPACGMMHDRDINAAKNTLDEGLRDLYQMTSAELADYRRGEDVRPKDGALLRPEAVLDEALIVF